MNKCNLFINWFESPVRPEEFDYCLKKNLEIFDRVINVAGNPTFSDFFREAAKYPTDVNVIANLDIYFTNSIRKAEVINTNEFWCMTRKENVGDGRIITFAQKSGGHPGEWSQDAWIFTGLKDHVQADFRLGMRGCDNHLAYIMEKQGYRVRNPSLSIDVIHLHNVDRNASTNRGEKVGNGLYIKVTPEEL